MLVDDSAVIRGLSARILDKDPAVEVVATAGDGAQAISALRRRSVDVVVLDIEMPVMDGLTALPKLLEIDPELKIVMSSTLTTRNADISLRAMRAGAADYIPKPSTARNMLGGDDFARELLAKVKGLGASRRGHMEVVTPARRSAATADARPARAAAPVALRKPSLVPPRVLVLGSSTGGPKALLTLFGGLRDKLRLPILLAQHMPATFTAMLAEHIAGAGGRPAAEGRDGTAIEAGHVYVAPGDHHMVVAEESGGLVLRLNQEPAENFCRPSVDPLLRSAARAYGPAVLAVILTGMGHDGLAGCEAIVEAGGTVVAQDEATSVVWGMPGAVATAGLCSAVLPLDDIADKIVGHAGGKEQR
ncbi:MAG: protein-glutamate methylesterase/protein-glutamine glutaminase [Alphaproteobacteria bacterium]